MGKLALQAKSQKEGGENEEKGCEKNEEKCGGWCKISIVCCFCFLAYNSIVPLIYFQMDDSTLHMKMTGYKVLLR